MTRALFTILLLVPAAAAATVHHVPSEYATIQAGIDACAAGDTVILAAGVFTGEGNRHLIVQVPLSLFGQGPYLTTIDCEGQGPGLDFWVSEGQLGGLAIRNAVEWAVEMYNAPPSSNPYRVSDLLLADSVGGGLQVHDGCLRGERLTVVRTAAMPAVFVFWGRIDLVDSVVAHNAKLGLGGYVDSFDGYVHGRVTATRCLLYANWGGNYNQGEPVGENETFAAPPLFCDVPDRDYRVHADSPCLPANNAWQVPIGATELGCTEPLLTIAGTVRDQHDLPGVGVFVDGDYLRSTTSDDGSFAFQLPPGSDLTLRPTRHHLVDFQPAELALLDPQVDYFDQDFRCTRLDSTREVPGEAASLAAALAMTWPGDTILLAPGVYTGAENCDGINLENRSLIGEGGVQETVIDYEHLHWGLRGGPGTFRGLTLRNAFGVALTVHDSTLEDLVIEGGGGGGGGLLAWGDVVARQVRIANVAGTGVQVQGHFTAQDLTVANCFSSGYAAGGISIDPYYVPEIQWSWPSTAHLDRCTLVGNGSDGCGSAILCSESELSLNASIIVGSTGAPAICRVDPLGQEPFAVTCTTFWANAAGDAAGHMEDPLGHDGNFAADPLFCAPGLGDYQLALGSPCLPANNDCGVQIGAFGQGCEETPVALASFTATPAAGAVELAWEADELADFRLTGARAAATWDVAWHAAGGGRFSAHDESPGLAPGGEVSYRLEGRLPGEDWQLLRELAVTLPPAFATRLLAPHPNPFNPTVTLPFTLAAPGRVRLEVFDLAGRRIATLADGHFAAGQQALTWDGRDGAGNPQASGVYFVRLAATGYTETKRMILLR